MIELIKIVILGFLQGITEMLPVSSSGHLVLAGYFMDVPNENALIEMALHIGTLLSILLFYRRRLVELVTGILNKDKASLDYAVQVIIASIPICIAGLVLKDFITAAFDSPRTVAFCLIGTGLWLATLFLPQKENGKISRLNAILVGLAQVIALLPGVSRSGATIVAARRLGIAPARAAEFSFLISVIPLAGVSVLAAMDVMQEGFPEHMGMLALFSGMLVAAITGYIALSLLVKLLTGHTFRYFSIYCLIAGIVLLFLV